MCSLAHSKKFQLYKQKEKKEEEISTFYPTQHLKWDQWVRKCIKKGEDAYILNVQRVT